MKKIISLLLLASIFVFSKTYIVNQKDSKISFNIKKLVWINVDGEFTKFNGTVGVNDDKIQAIYGEVDSSSVLTDSEKRDTELKAFESMLWAMKYPKIIFEAISANKTQVIANLTIKNQTKKITFKIDSFKATDKKVEIYISSKISRKAFAVGGFPVLVDDNVKIKATIIAYRE